VSSYRFDPDASYSVTELASVLLDIEEQPSNQMYASTYEEDQPTVLTGTIRDDAATHDTQPYRRPQSPDGTYAAAAASPEQAHATPFPFRGGFEDEVALAQRPSVTGRCSARLLDRPNRCTRGMQLDLTPLGLKSAHVCLAVMCLAFRRNTAGTCLPLHRSTAMSLVQWHRCCRKWAWGTDHAVILHGSALCLAAGTHPTLTTTIDPHHQHPESLTLNPTRTSNPNPLPRIQCQHHRRGRPHRAARTAPENVLVLGRCLHALPLVLDTARAAPVLDRADPLGGQCQQDRRETGTHHHPSTCCTW
jgi:hypothetical protein